MSPFGHARGWVLFVTLVLGGLAVAPARAQTDADKRQRAKEHYEIATRFYDVGKYGEAIGEYEAAYLLTGDPALLFNIGQAYRLWDRPEDALRVYKNYLRQRPDAVNRGDVEKKIADLERVVEERRHEAGAPVEPPVAAPTPVAPSPAPPLGGSPPTGIPLPEPPSPPPVLAEPPAGMLEQPVPGVSEEPTAGPSSNRWLAYSLLGLGGASLVTAAVAGMVGAAKAKKLEDASRKREVFDPAVESNGKTANAVAFVSAVVGLAATGVGGYLWWTGRGAASSSVSVVPAVAPAYAGAAARLAF